jgi:hypothetical protein
MHTITAAAQTARRAFHLRDMGLPMIDASQSEI